MTKPQEERLSVLMRSSLGADIKLMLVERLMPDHTALLVADDHVRMFRAQGRVAAISDLLNWLEALERMVPETSQTNEA